MPHGDRLELDGRRRFQLLRRPDAEPAETWSEIAVPGAWTQQGFPDLLLGAERHEAALRGDFWARLFVLEAV